MPLDISCAFATSAYSHEQAKVAQDLGYKRAWFYDSPALYLMSGSSSAAPRTHIANRAVGLQNRG